MTKQTITRRILLYEILGFGIVFFFLWANEIFDLPHLLFGFQSTPINWVESLMESGLTLVLGVGTIFLTRNLLQHIKYLEGFLPVCSFCKKIRIAEEWVPIEDFISNRSEVIFSHGLCPECSRMHYPEIFCEEKPQRQDGV